MANAMHCATLGSGLPRFSPRGEGGDSPTCYGRVSSWWNSARTLVSIYVHNDAGLMLVGASQLSLSTMNVAVEVLHSLDKPGLTLECFYSLSQKVGDCCSCFGVTGSLSSVFLNDVFLIVYLSLSHVMMPSVLSTILTGLMGPYFLKNESLIGVLGVTGASRYGTTTQYGFSDIPSMITFEVKPLFLRVKMLLIGTFDFLVKAF
ncbi:hypothetical protein V8E53_007077 [Lactarius tabidus]